MSRPIRITHRTVEVDEGETQYFLVLTEYCSKTKKIRGTYLVRLPDLVALDDDPKYKFYQPIFN